MRGTVCFHDKPCLFVFDLLFLCRTHLSKGDKVTLRNVNLIRDKSLVMQCSGRTTMIVESNNPVKRTRLDDSYTVLPFGLLASLPFPLFQTLSKCRYDVRALDERTYSLFMERMLLWKFRDKCKQVHPLLRFFGIEKPESTEPFELAQFKSVDQLASIVRFMAFHDKQQWTQGLFSSSMLPFWGISFHVLLCISDV